MVLRGFKQKLDIPKIQEKVKDYLYGNLYPVVTAAVVLLFWILNLQIVGISFLVVTSFYIFVTQRDLTPIFPLLFSAPMTFSNLSLFSTFVPILIFAPVPVALAIHFIRFPIKKPVTGKVFFPLAAVSAVLFLGGIFSPHIDTYSLGIQYILCAGVAMLAEYFVLFQYIEPSENFNIKKYFAFSVICVAMLAFAQLIIVDVQYYSLHGHLLSGNFAWANTIHIAFLALLAVPMCFYLMTVCKNIIPPFIALLAFLGCILLSQSDGAIGIVAILIIPIIIITYFKIHAKNRTLYSILFFVLCVSVVLTAIILFAQSEEFYIAFLRKHFLNDTGRTGIYVTALQTFLECPIFGAGLGYANTLYITVSGNKQLLLSYFHSTVFQVMATMGIVGILVYIWYFIARIRVFNGTDKFNFFAFLSFLLYESYAFIDNGEFNFLIIYVTAFVLFTEAVNKKGRKYNSLPLKTNPENIYSA